MKSKKNTYIIVIIISSFLLFTILYNNIRNTELKKKGIYTIACVKEAEGARGGMKLYIEYIYKGQKISNSFIESTGIDSKKYLGKRFLILIRSDKPTANFHFFFDKPVPDSIMNAPDNGWKNLPF